MWCTSLGPCMQPRIKQQTEKEKPETFIYFYARHFMHLKCIPTRICRWSISRLRLNNINGITSVIIETAGIEPGRVCKYNGFLIIYKPSEALPSAKWIMHWFESHLCKCSITIGDHISKTRCNPKHLAIVTLQKRRWERKYENRKFREADE